MAMTIERRSTAALYDELYAVIRAIPRGAVATYAQLAELVGVPRGGRVTAAALKVSQPAHGLPWHRVVGKRGPTRGRIAIPDPVGAALQRQLLTREQVLVDDRGHLDLVRFGWLPGDQAHRTRPVVTRRTSGPKKPRGQRGAGVTCSAVPSLR